ncbi:MAG: hypothetical protein JO011_03740 [Ktedonobacteraceae bacterium]|nr:hypothetical protein [Ktedonobacteraceae bacterium]MBV9710015.1 hypothetical protein [Ktedonobacteraceae bacterium]
MNIWDSVQRGLEKATQEATRRAKTQRLRSTIDNLTQQIHTQEDDLIVRAMEIFAAGHLTQSELLPLCQKLAHLQQQQEQAQQELNMVQNQGQTQLPPTIPGTAPASVYTPPPDYQPYDQTQPAPLPPPPPGMATPDSFNKVIMSTPPGEKQLCAHCHVVLIPGDAYCHNCGAPTGKGELTQLPTALVATPEEAQQNNPQSASPTPSEDLQTLHDNLPSQEGSDPDSPTRSEEKDRGA